MTRLRNTATGVVVDVSDEMASRLSGFVPADEKPAEKPKPARRVKVTTEDDK